MIQVTHLSSSSPINYSNCDSNSNSNSVIAPPVPAIKPLRNSRTHIVNNSKQTKSTPPILPILSLNNLTQNSNSSSSPPVPLMEPTESLSNTTNELNILSSHSTTTSTSQLAHFKANVSTVFNFLRSTPRTSRNEESTDKSRSSSLLG